MNRVCLQLSHLCLPVLAATDAAKTLQSRTVYSTLGVSGAIPPVSHMPYWREQGSYYRLFLQTSFPV